jgi:two-component system sensor histidine kinase MprB
VLRRLRTFADSLTLQRRVGYLTTVAVALAVTASSVAAYASLRFELYRTLDADLIEVATSVAVPVASDISSFGGISAPTLRATNVSVAAVRADGTVYYVPGEQIHLETGDEELAIAKLQYGHSVRSGVGSNGEPYRIVAVPMPQLGNYALVLGRPLRPTQQILGSLWLVMTGFGVVGVILAGVAGATVARSSLRPVRQLSAAVERVIDTGELDPIPISGDDELARFAGSFNRMLLSLATSRERQRQLIADASHELRTPLTSLRTNIELLAADETAGMLSREDRAAILADVSAQLAEFTTLINDLVQLARDERVAPSPEPIDLRDVVNAALERVRRRGHGLVFDVELNPFYVLGEAETLERAVANLLDNAVKWSPPGGTIRVQLEGGRLRVADQGPGIREEDMPYVFDRFFRSDAARNTPGTGLGLSIVAQTVARHGGWVRVGRSAQGGAEFTLNLPGSTTLEGLSRTSR